MAVAAGISCHCLLLPPPQLSLYPSSSYTFSPQNGFRQRNSFFLFVFEGGTELKLLRLESEPSRFRSFVIGRLLYGSSWGWLY